MGRTAKADRASVVLHVSLAPELGAPAALELGMPRDPYEAAFRASPVALALARDPHCAVVLRNPAMNRFVPASLDWHAWRLPDGSAPPSFEAGVPLALERQPLRLAAFRGEPTTDREIELRWPGRAPIFLSVSATPLFDANGAPCGAIASARDITADRIARRAGALPSRAQAGAQRDAGVDSRAKDELLGLIGHELRNPMNAITTALEVFERADPGAPEAQSARRIIGRQTQRLARLVGELGEIGRALSGGAPAHREPLELGSVVARCIADAEPTLTAKRLRLRRELAPVRIDADPVPLSDAFRRLLDDAMRRAPDGHEIAVRLRQGTGSGSAQAILEIGDAEALEPVGSGVAAPPASTEAVRTVPGLGMALALVRHAIERHGGRIEARRLDSGGGQTVVVRLPLAGSLDLF